MYAILVIISLLGATVTATPAPFKSHHRHNHHRHNHRHLTFTSTGIESVTTQHSSRSQVVKHQLKLHDIPPIRRAGITATSSELVAGETLLNSGVLDGSDSQYYGTIGFGTPPQTFTVMIDTSSSGIRVPGIMCAIPCLNQRQFDWTLSATFVNHGETQTVGFEKDGPSTSFDQQSVDLLKVKDAMMLLGSRFPDTEFNLITNQTAGFFTDLYDGILGLNYDPNATFYQTLRRNGFPALFGLYLTPRTFDGSEFILGGVDQSKLGNGSSSLSWIPVASPTISNNRWAIAPTKIFINHVEVDPKLFAGQLFELNSAETHVVVGRDLAIAINSEISSTIQPIGAGGYFGLPCSRIPSYHAEITFTFNASTSSSSRGSNSLFNLTIPSRDLNAGRFQDNPTFCHTIIRSAKDLTAGGGIIGIALLKHYYSVWDVDGGRLGFASNGL